MKTLLFLVCLALSGCVSPIIEELGKDRASICIVTERVTLCRTNQVGTVIVAGELNIAHGVMMEQQEPESDGLDQTEASGR